MKRTIKTLNAISKQGLSRLPETYTVANDATDPDAILVRSSDMHKLDIPPSLLAVGRAGAGTNNIPVKVALINNTVLGMVRQWQNLFYGERYSNTDLNVGVERQVPDFVALAEAYSMPARRVEVAEDVDEAINWALSINDRPVLLDFRVSKDAMVWPMVAAGVSNDDIRFARGMAPIWDEDE